MFADIPTLEIFTDASSLGWGAHTSAQATGGRWSVTETKNHINWLELKAVSLGLKYFAKHLSHATLQIFIDNTVALSYINNQGGSVNTLNNLAKEIWAWSKSNDLWLTASHIPGVENNIADKKSRIFHENTEWSLNQQAFLKICDTFGTPDIDLFASRLNAKVGTYCSWEPDPDSYRVDAFSFSWKKFKCCYAFPPFNLIGHVIRKMVRDNVRNLILVCPKWPGQYWFPLLLKYKSLSHDYICFENDRDLLRLPFDSDRVHGIWNKLNLCCFRLSSRR
jgi:hypothetical protein